MLLAVYTCKAQHSAMSILHYGTFTGIGIEDSPKSFNSDTNLVVVDVWTFEDWDTEKFNPYKFDMGDLPFHIEFEEETYAMPIDGPLVVTSRYGWRDGTLHRGIDIDLKTGDEVYALLDGKVRYVKSHAGHGRTVVIRHKNGLETVYAHLSTQLVIENEVVEKGQVIGKGGTTGNARGSHLHLEVRYQGKTINPEYFFDFSKTDKVRSLVTTVDRDHLDPKRYSSLKKAIFFARNKNNSKQSTSYLERHAQSDDKQTYDDSNPYVIQAGDTLYSLSIKHGHSLAELCQYNSIKDAFSIKIGQKVVLDF